MDWVNCKRLLSETKSLENINLDGILFMFIYVVFKLINFFMYWFILKDDGITHYKKNKRIVSLINDRFYQSFFVATQGFRESDFDYY